MTATTAPVPLIAMIRDPAWLAFIILNLLLIADYYDVALRDFGLLAAATTLFLLSFHRPVSTRAYEQEYDHV